MPTALLNGIDIYFERRGDGPPVLFLNGSGATLAGSGILLDVFAARCDVLAHDQRGLGRTDIPLVRSALRTFKSRLPRFLSSRNFNMLCSDTWRHVTGHLYFIYGHEPRLRDTYRGIFILFTDMNQGKG